MDDTIKVTSLNNLNYNPGVKLPSQPLGGLAASGNTIFVACKEHIVAFQDGKVMKSILINLLLRY
jgi:hypothetical protein